MDRLRTFGGLGIERDGALVESIGVHRKALALLAVIAAQNGAGRERLAAMLWPESDVNRARGSLKQALHLVRHQLGAADLLLGTAEIRLNPERIEADVALFSRALERNDPAAAVRYYTGPFLDSVYLEGAPEFERWAESKRSELARQHAGALEQLAAAAEARGDHAHAVEWWRRLQSGDPLNSRVAVRLMLSLESAGDRAAALQHARIHEALLRQELGISPDLSVVALADRLRSSHTPPRPRQLTTAIATPDADNPTVEAREPGLEDPHPPTARSSAIADSPRRRRIPRPALLTLLAVAGLGGVLVALTRVQEGALSAPPDGRASRAPAAAVPVPDQASIAVLPFLDLSPAHDQEHFSDGIAAELTSTLARIDGLRVAARTSAFQFKGRNPDVREVGRRLGVAHVLEGSVRRAGGRLRITAQLVSTETGFHLWSETYEREEDDVFAVQEEISRSIVDALQVRLAAADRRMLAAAPTADVGAYEQYLKGLYFLNRLQIPRAIESLEEAIRRDSQFARAHAALAEAYAVPVGYSGLTPQRSYVRGIAAAQTAIRLDPRLAEAHAALGWLEMIGFRWGEAEGALLRAIELNPASSRARFYHAMYLHRQGRLDEAFEQVGRARALDPLSLPINAIYGSFLGDLGRVDEAIAHLEGTLELDSSFAIAHAVLGHVYLGIGRYDEAIRHYERAAESVPIAVYSGFLGHAYARAGRTEDARRILGQVRERSTGGESVSPGVIGWILLGLDEGEDGFRWMERAVEERDALLTIYAVLSNRYLSDPFQDDPRFQRLRRRAGLPSRVAVPPLSAG